MGGGLKPLEGSRSRVWRKRGNSIDFIDHHFDLPDIARTERREPKQRTRADSKASLLLLYTSSIRMQTPRGQFATYAALPYSGGAFACAGLGAGCACATAGLGVAGLGAGCSRAAAGLGAGLGAGCA
jgi:hypothetical protein